MQELETLMGLNFQLCPIFVQLLKLGHRLSNVRRSIGNLRFPNQIINEDKEALKKVQATDAKLENIRRRVKSKSSRVTLSRGLNRGQTKGLGSQTVFLALYFAQKSNTIYYLTSYFLCYLNAYIHIQKDWLQKE